MSMLFLVCVCLLAPLFTAGISRILPPDGKIMGITAMALQGIAAAAGILLIFASIDATPALLWSVTWFRAGTQDISFGIEINREVLLMTGVVQLVAFLVYVYSGAYMAKDSGIRRFWFGIGIFTAAMNLFVVSASTIQLFLAWELIGFASFLLIGHDHQDATAGIAAGKAFLMNRIGDAIMLSGILILGFGAGTFYISETLTWLVQSLKEDSYLQHTATWGGALLLCGMLSKSAQVPLQVWLPDAMKGPTPVSALMHAATLVAAGIWLLFRFHVVFQVEALQTIAILIGGITFLVAGISACFQWDIKKILAYSTMGQLGLMVAGMGAGSGEAALLHLWIHGLFKCGLFLVAGILIYVHHQDHHNGDANDIRNLSLQGKPFMLLRLSFILMAASMAGIPGLAGIFGKEAILADLLEWANGSSWRVAIFTAILISNAFTGAYLFRLGWYLIKKQPETSGAEWLSIPARMLVPVVILAILNIWIFVAPIPIGTTWMDMLTHDNQAVHPPWWLLMSGTGAVAAGAFLGWIRLRSGKPENALFAESARSGLGFNELWMVMAKDTAQTCSALLSWIDIHIVDALIARVGSLFYASPGTQTPDFPLSGNIEKRNRIPSLSQVSSFIDIHVADALVNRIARQAYSAGRGMAELQRRSLQRNLILALAVILAIASIITYFAGIFTHG